MRPSETTVRKFNRTFGKVSRPRPTTTCAHCRRDMNNFAGGSSRGYNGEPLCHPNETNRPDCYKLVTLYRHETPCQSNTCYEDHPELLTYVESAQKTQRKKNHGK